MLLAWAVLVYYWLIVAPAELREREHASALERSRGWIVCDPTATEPAPMFPHAERMLCRPLH